MTQTHQGDNTPAGHTLDRIAQGVEAATSTTPGAPAAIPVAVIHTPAPAQPAAPSPVAPAPAPAPAAPSPVAPAPAVTVNVPAPAAPAKPE